VNALRAADVASRPAEEVLRDLGTKTSSGHVSQDCGRRRSSDRRSRAALPERERQRDDGHARREEAPAAL
jgi:hypothetical protein